MPDAGAAMIFRSKKWLPPRRRGLFGTKNIPRRGGVDFLMLKVLAAGAAWIFRNKKCSLLRRHGFFGTKNTRHRSCWSLGRLGQSAVPVTGMLGCTKAATAPGGVDFWKRQEAAAQTASIARGITWCPRLPLPVILRKLPTAPSTAGSIAVPQKSCNHYFALFSAPISGGRALCLTPTRFPVGMLWRGLLFGACGPRSHERGYMWRAA